MIRLKCKIETLPSFEHLYKCDVNIIVLYIAYLNQIFSLLLIFINEVLYLTLQLIALPLIRCDT